MAWHTIEGHREGPVFAPGSGVSLAATYVEKRRELLTWNSFVGHRFVAEASPTGTAVDVSWLILGPVLLQ